MAEEVLGVAEVGVGAEVWGFVLEAVPLAAALVLPSASAGAETAADLSGRILLTKLCATPALPLAGFFFSPSGFFFSPASAVDSARSPLFTAGSCAVFLGLAAFSDSLPGTDSLGVLSVLACFLSSV